MKKRVHQKNLDDDVSLLRFSTIGSVDDGKSTLIGRLLYDSKSIFDDQLAAIERASENHGDGELNLALFTDGLKAEREQGITIDVAYRYFSTPTRKFIVSDCPGHVEYTRNMITGTSMTDLVVLLVDARKGILEQTKRHSLISSLLQVKHLVLAINKMDLVHYDQRGFDNIKKDLSHFLSRSGIPDIQFIPISALKGDNIVHSSKEMPWYKGLPLLQTLENVYVASDSNFIDARFPIQRVIRPIPHLGFEDRHLLGRVEGGVFKPGDEVVILPSGFTSKIKAILTKDGEVKEAFYPMSVNIVLEDDFDIGRGDMLAKSNNRPQVSQDIDLTLCWLHETPLKLNGKYVLKHTTQEVRCVVKETLYKMDIHSLHKLEKDREIGLNDIGRIRLRTSSPLFFDVYKRNRNTGSLILIDEVKNETVAAGLLL